MKFEDNWIELKNIKLNKVTQSHKDNSDKFSLNCGSQLWVFGFVYVRKVERDPEGRGREKEGDKQDIDATKRKLEKTGRNLHRKKNWRAIIKKEGRRDK